MPKITITKQFHYRNGLDVERYAPGKQDVSPAVAAHAIANGFAEQPQKPARAPAAEPTGSAG